MVDGHKVDTLLQHGPGACSIYRGSMQRGLLVEFSCEFPTLYFSFEVYSLVRSLDLECLVVATTSCSLTSSLILTLIQTPLDPSRLLVLLDRSRLYHMTSRSRAYLLSLFCCRLIIIILNPNPSPSLSTHSSYNKACRRGEEEEMARVPSTTSGQNTSRKCCSSRWC